MSKSSWIKMWLPWMILASMVCMIGTGCAKPPLVIPQIGSQAVPNILLPERPELDPFTKEEMKAIPRSAHGKILKNQAAWWGYASIAQAAVQGYRDYILTVFGGKKESEPPPKKKWFSWGK